MNKKDFFVALKKVTNHTILLSQMELSNEAYETASKTFEGLIENMSSVLDKDFEWRFVDYENKEITIEIYDCLEVYITIYTDNNNELYYEIDVFNPFAEEYMSFNLPENKGLKELIYNVWVLEESNEFREIRDYVDLMNDAHRNYQKFRKILMDKIGTTFDDAPRMYLEREIIKRKLNLD